MAIATPSMHQAQMEVMGPHAMGTEYIPQVLRDWVVADMDSPREGAGHTAQSPGRATTHHGMGPAGVVAARQDLRLHQQVDGQGVPHTNLNKRSLDRARPCTATGCYGSV